jgi:hypothetical protein
VTTAVTGDTPERLQTLSEEQLTNSQPAEGSQEEDLRVDRDGFLELLIHLVESEEMTAAEGAAEAAEVPPPGVTLSVGGLLITGTVISRQSYIDGVATVRHIMKMVKENTPPNDKEEFDRHFIHLKDARFIFPNSEPLPHNQGVYWRGRLNRVDGWAMGRMMAEREQP